MTARCETCRFFNRAEKRGVTQFWCHRYPKSVTISRSYWCGEYERAQEDVGMKFSHWVAFQLTEDLISGMRVGQSYMNRVRPTEKMPELFYERDDSKSWKIIAKLEE